jgi:transposase
MAKEDKVERGAVWAGADAGKEQHHVAVVDEAGTVVFSRRVANDEPELRQVITEVTGLAARVRWAVDLRDGAAALLLALLAVAGAEIVYVPGRMVNRMTGAYRGEGKTDAKDARIIADQARMRSDLAPLAPGDELATELRMLTARRADLVADRTRAINRLRAVMLEVSPALERALDFTRTGPLILISGGYATPQAIRAAGQHQLTGWLRGRGARNAAKLAAAAVSAATSQTVRLPGQDIAAALAAELAGEVMALNERVRQADELIAARFRRHRSAAVITSLPGIGPLPGAEFLVATGGDMAAFAGSGHLAGYAGLAPAPRDSGRRTGNLHRPKRYNRLLNRVFYTSALISIAHCEESRAFYDRKRAEGKKHTQAVLALARRRVNVLWAMLRDNQPYQPRTATSKAASEAA